MCVNTKIFCGKIKVMYFGGLKVLKLEKRKLSEKVGVSRPASHFFFLAIRSGNVRRSNPTFTIKKRALRAHFFIMAEKVAIQSSGLTFLFPRYSLGKCSAFESHLRDSKIDLQKEVYFANWRKRWVPIVRPRISISSLFAREMLGVRIPPSQ